LKYQNLCQIPGFCGCGEQKSMILEVSVLMAISGLFRLWRAKIDDFIEFLSKTWKNR
jgi:hypothetical protein